MHPREGVTAGKSPFAGVSTCKSATETSPGGNPRGGTGKPHELETQKMVGALLDGKSTEEEAREDAQINGRRPEGYRTWLTGARCEKGAGDKPRRLL